MNKSISSLSKENKSLGLVFICFIAFFFILSTNQTAPLSVVHAEEHTIKSIIFDLNGVLFTTNSLLKYKLIWSTVWQNPSLLYYLVIFSVEKEYFTLLHTIPAISDCILYHKCQPMPQIMADWQIAATNNIELKNKIFNTIQNSHYPASIKNFFIAIADFMFTPEKLAQSQSPVLDMIKLAKQLKHGGYKIYALSNWDKESFQIIHDQYPEIFELFDHFLISGHEKIAKPSAEFFQRLINSHQIDPANSIFIDDEPYNLQTAQQLGINTILCTGTRSVTKELQKLGVIA